MTKQSRMRKSLYVALGISCSALIVAAIIGAIEDAKGVSCNGLAGGRISCVEEYTFYWVGIIAIPVIALLISVLFIDSLKIDAGETEVKPKKRH